MSCKLNYTVLWMIFLIIIIIIILSVPMPLPIPLYYHHSYQSLCTTILNKSFVSPSFLSTPLYHHSYQSLLTAIILINNQPLCSTILINPFVPQLFLSIPLYHYHSYQSLCTKIIFINSSVPPSFLPVLLTFIFIFFCDFHSWWSLFLLFIILWSTLKVARWM